MKFIDETLIEIHSGKGGDGCVSFRREKFVPFGGPDGGNGGRGGHIYVVAEKNLNTLLHFRGRRVYRAGPGEQGRGQMQDGHSGEDLILKVPLGTQIYDTETGELITDIVEQSEPYLLAEGGQGGIGNTFFKSSVQQAPRKFIPGGPSVSRKIRLELKVLAHFGLVGLPNAGKSTLISALSNARPKVAAYPFTTLHPNLGVVAYGDSSWVVADIPGLIPGAGEGKGLGTQFLKHIERTSSLIHLVDIASCEDPFQAYDHYTSIREELDYYKRDLAQKNEIVALTKIDALTSERVEEFREFFQRQLDKKVLTLSAVSGASLEKLKEIMFYCINSRALEVENG